VLVRLARTTRKGARLAIGFDDAAIIDLVDGFEPAKIAIDAPFGSPSPFVAAVGRDAAGESWEGQTVGSLRLRATDLHVIAEVGQQRLSVSADRIAVTAFRMRRAPHGSRDGGSQD
jgi:hypothetical protein